MKRGIIFSIILLITVVLSPISGFSADTDIIINEIMGNPGSSDFDQDHYEFVELYNTGTSSVDVGSWHITDGVGVDSLVSYDAGGLGTITDPDAITNTTTIPAGAYAVILDPEYADTGVEEIYDFPENTIILTVDDTTDYTICSTNGLYSNSQPLTLFKTLGGGGEVSDIIDTYGTPDLSDLNHYSNLDDNGTDHTPIKTLSTTSSIPILYGYSAERKEPATGDNDTNWGLSSSLHGTPGAENSKTGMGQVSDIVITEVMANPPGDLSAEGYWEFVEINNKSGTDAVDVGNWWITDGDSVDRIVQWDTSTHGTITDGDVVTGTTTIPASGFGVILDPDYTAGGTQPYDFAPDTVILTTEGPEAGDPQREPDIGNGLANATDPVTIFSIRAGASALDVDTDTIASTYGTPDLSDLTKYYYLDDDGADSIPFDPENGYSVVRREITQGDTASNWTRSRGPTCTPGMHYYSTLCSTSFEHPEFVSGTIEYQSLWHREGAQGAIQTDTVYHHLQAVELTPDNREMALVTRELPTGKGDSAWVSTLHIKPSPASAPELQSMWEAASLFYFDETSGIMALDGNGSGTGTWTSTGVSCDENTWYSIKTVQDYVNHTWDIYIDDMDTPKLTGLGFKDNTVSYPDLLEFFSEKGSSFVDQIEVIEQGSGESPDFSFISVYHTEDAFSPNADTVKDITTIFASLTMSADWTITIKDDQETVVKTFTGTGDIISQDWDGKDNSDQLLSDGTYTYQIEAIEPVSQETIYSATDNLEIDTTSPTADITSPADQEQIEGEVSIQGTASAADLAYYRVLIGEGETPSAYDELEYSTSSVVSGELATLNTSDYSNGTYQIKLETEDDAGNSAEDSVVVTIANTGITDAYAQPQFFNPNQESTTIYFTLSDAADITVKLYHTYLDFTGTNPNDGEYTTEFVRDLISQESRSSGANTVTWDGKDASQEILPYGAYTYVIEAYSSGQKIGEYNPAYYRTNVIPRDVSFPSPFRPFRNEQFELTYNIEANAWMTLGIKRPEDSTQTAYWAILGQKARPREANVTHTEYWDGLDYKGDIIEDGTFEVHRLGTGLPENVVVTDDETYLITQIRIEPYIIFQHYSQICTIHYTISETGYVTVKIYDPSQALVRTLVNDVQKTQGDHSVEWNLENSSGRLVPDKGQYEVEITIRNSDDTTTFSRRANILVK